MKKKLLIAALAMTTIAANAQTKNAPVKEAAPAAVTTNWNLDKTHSSVKFSVDHLVISEVEGNFKMFEGSMKDAGTDFSGAKINFTVDVNSINTDDEKRDGHLKGADFFDAEKFPQMKFVSSNFKKVAEKKYLLQGDLTIRDVTKKVNLMVNYGGTTKDPWGNIKAGFKATTKISRKDYGLKWNTLTEAGGAVVGDEVRIQVNVEFAQAK
jgi:polyisoprenoid-binding protein YceI